ncbi:hypothetical protein SAMN05192529_10783 [Arachidicoccus rhizosphaerae]|uniref:Outer membrane protein beta-barrel domain-containing protein n=1 Tax=Arachidicoccus rhizosphaerae TaxID=551991 RepID=A0A1H3Y369_9BACT|nr:hypothetical protein [Arachidicoccus rhizosphaerae]SEA06175.1 hypothetical protein SAMN05192529_10783 [Arachidicoccus rhizosphaerae]
MQRKITVFISLFSLLSCAVNAQARFDLQRRSELSIGLENAFPLNGWDLYAKNTKSASFGVGLSLKYVYKLNDVLATTTQIGGLHFFANNLGGTKVNSGQFFIKGGLRLNAGCIYFEPEFGISTLSGNVPDTVLGGFGESSITPFTYAAVIGVFAAKCLDISLRYEGMVQDATVGYMGLRVAYKIPLN